MSEEEIKEIKIKHEERLSHERKRRRKEMKELIEYEQQLKDWLYDLEYKIYELEGIYLDETPMGNILKGWEIDGKPFSSRPRSVDEKERLFSNSSYRLYMEGKLSSSIGGNTMSGSSPAPSTLSAGVEDKGRTNIHYNHPKKKARRSSSLKKDGIYDEWENDY